MLRVSGMVLIVYGGLLGLTWIAFNGIPELSVPFNGQRVVLIPAVAKGTVKVGSFDLSSGVATGFIPTQDKGYLLVNVELPDAASTGRTAETMRRDVEEIALYQPGSHWQKVETPTAEGATLVNEDLVWRIARELALAAELDVDDGRRSIHRQGHGWRRGPRVEVDLRDHVGDRATAKTVWAVKARLVNQFDSISEAYRLKGDHKAQEVFKRAKRKGVRHVVAVSGQSLLLNANAPNFASMYVMLDPFEERLGPGLSGDELAAQLEEEFRSIGEARIHVFGAPPVEGLGTAGGFKMIVEDRTNTEPEELQKVSEKFIDKGNDSGEVTGLYTSFKANTPWLEIVYARQQGQTMSISFSEVGAAMTGFLGSYYINDFNRFGRTWRVVIQAMQEFRQNPRDLKQIKLKTPSGQMVPAGAVADARLRNGPVMIVRYNMYQAAAINGNPGAGISSGQAIQRMEREVKELQTKGEVPPGMRTEWTELALLQLQTGNTAIVVFCLAVVLVFLVLAAQYESWSLPLAVILVVPMCLLCSLAAVVVAHHDINIFTQIGFVVLVGLACKNAILIVEFAKKQHESGVPRYEATLEACKLRLRPILMTSFAFIFGVVPLVLSEGAGAEMRRTLGTAVFGGMLGVTLFGIFLTPVFFYVIQYFADRRKKHVAAADETSEPASTA
jgi:multidrug efflux pump subunit AcrB